MSDDLLSIEEEAAACRAAFAGVPVGAPVWCCHHDALCEPLIEPAEVRIVYIETIKPLVERARRLREFRLVRGELPVEYVKAGAEWAKANAAEWAKGYAEYAKASAEWDKASADHLPALEALHRAEYPNSAWDGRTIFGKREVLYRG